MNTIANFFVHERLKITEVYSELNRTYNMELLTFCQKSLSISAKSSILDVRLGSEYVSASFFPGTLYLYTFLPKKNLYIISLNKKMKRLIVYQSFKRSKRTYSKTSFENSE